MRKEHTKALSNQFTDQSFFRALSPAWISALGLALGDMADALVVGQSMGATGLAAVSLALPVFMIINLLMHGFGAGGSIRYSRLLGSGQQQQANRTFAQVLQASAAAGVCLAVLGNLFLAPLMGILGASPQDGEVYYASSTYVRMIISSCPIFFLSYLFNYYLRNDDNEKLASFGFTVGNLCDLGLNVLLVLVLDMGVRGAALSTILGQCVALGFYLPGVFGPRAKTLRYRPARPDLKEVGGCFQIGLSTSVQYVYQMIFLLVVTNTLMRSVGEGGVAVFDVLQNVSYLVLYLYDGAAKASQPLISTFCGERYHDGIRRAERLAMTWGNAAGLALCAVISVFAGPVCGIFGLEGAELLALGSRALRVYCLSLLFAGTSALMESCCQAREEERSALVLATLRGAAVLLPCTFLFAMLDIRWFWWMFPVVEILSQALFFGWRRLKPTAQTLQEPALTQLIAGNSSQVSNLTANLEVFCEEHEASPKQSYYVMMATEEVCLALMSQAFKDPEAGLIQVTCVACADHSFELYIRDNAVEFDPFSLTEMNAEAPVSMLDSIGMSVIQKKAAAFFYRHYQGFNTLYIKI